MEEKKLVYVGPPNRKVILASTMKVLGPFNETNVIVDAVLTEQELSDCLGMREKGREPVFKLVEKEEN